MPLPETLVNTQVLLTVIALVVAPHSVLTTPTTVRAVALVVNALWVMALWWSSTPYWTSTPSGCTLGRVGSR